MATIGVDIIYCAFSVSVLIDGDEIHLAVQAVRRPQFVRRVLAKTNERLAGAPGWREVGGRL